MSQHCLLIVPGLEKYCSCSSGAGEPDHSQHIVRDGISVQRVLTPALLPMPRQVRSAGFCGCSSGVEAPK